MTTTTPGATLSGYDALLAIADGKAAPPAMAETIPMSFEKIEHGLVVFHATPDERHLNPLGGVHGGFAATVLDSVTGCAVHSTLEAGVGYATIELDIKMIRPLTAGKIYIATGKVINVSRSVGFSEASLQDDAGKVFAHATATCAIIRK